MKADPDVKMISAEAPILFAKACDMFITELTMRAWIHAEENKRRTLQRSDIAAALLKSDMFDFLIDIVPREAAATQHKRRNEFAAAAQYAVAEPQMTPPPASGMQEGAPLQQSAQHAMGPSDFAGMHQHMPQEGQYPTQAGMYPPPQAPQQYQQQAQMFAPQMYGGYGMPQQTVGGDARYPAQRHTAGSDK